MPKKNIFPVVISQMARRIKRRLGRSYRGRRARTAARRVARASRVGASRRARYYRTRSFMRYTNPLTFNRFVTRLTYYDTCALDPAANSLTTLNGAIYQFRANSVYDPDYTGIGHQPMYFDNFASLYTKYRVLSSKITVTVCDIRPGGVIADDITNAEIMIKAETLRLMISRDEGTEIPNDFRNAIETRGSAIKWRFVAPSMTGRLATLSHTCTPHTLLAVSKRDDSLVGTTSTNPSKTAMYTIAVASADGQTNPPFVTVAVKIDYVVEFFDRVTQQFQN